MQFILSNCKRNLHPFRRRETRRSIDVRTQEAALNAITGIRLKRPAHPGGFVKREIIDPFGLSVTRAAEVPGVTRTTLSTLLNERASLSPDMAIRIEKAFGVSMDTLMRMQNS